MIHAVGIVPADHDMMPYKTVKLLNTADVIVGFETVLNIPRPHFNPFAEVISINYKNQPQQMEVVREQSREKKFPFLCLSCYKNDDPSGLTLSTLPASACKQVLNFFKKCKTVNFLEFAIYLSDLYRAQR